MRNVLTQAAGVRETVELQLLERRLAVGDVLLLSSDGLHGVLGDDWIRSVLVQKLDERATIKQLIEDACEQGAPDNVSCILLRFGV
jgi:protein phosphatase